jgi:glycosyltransferase involved in cell wall biosynthesis
MKPRVVHVASGREWRGGQRQVYLLARALARGAEVEQSVVTGADSELARRLEGAGLRVVACPWRIGLDPRVLRPLARVAGEGPCIIHAHDAHALRLATLVIPWVSRPLVATRRTTFPLRKRTIWSRPMRVIAVSQAVRTALLAGGLDARRITVIHDGVDLEYLARVRPVGIRERLGWPAETPVAVSVAALTAEKGHIHQVDAARELAGAFPQLRWAIAGEGEERPGLEQRIASLGLADRVRLLGWLPEPEALIADATVFVHTALQEGLGSSILDAMALGVPVVAFASGGVPELLQGEAGALTPSGDPQALAREIRSLLESSERRRRMAARARELAHHFSDDGMARAHLSVYRSISRDPDA